MSLDSFLSYLQQLITMVDPEDPYSVDLAKDALDATVEITLKSQMASQVVQDVMKEARREFQFIVKHKDSYAGVPGDLIMNGIKRRRLGTILRPGC